MSSDFDCFIKSSLSQVIDDLSAESSTNLEKVEKEGARPSYGIRDVKIGPGPIWSITFDYLHKGTPFSKFIDIMKGVEAEKQKRLSETKY